MLTATATTTATHQSNLAFARGPDDRSPAELVEYSSHRPLLIQRAYKAELRPTAEQVELLARHCGTARFAFNFALGRKIDHYEKTGKALPYREIDAEFNAKKRSGEEFEWANGVSKWSHQNAIRDCEKAFQNFFQGIKGGKKVGFPRFKSKHRSTPKYRVAGERVTVFADRIRLPKIGPVRLRRHDYIPTSGVKLNSATISQRAGRWFISVQVEETIEVPENQRQSFVGIDLGLVSFAVGSDGSRLDSPKPLARSLKKMRRLSRLLSRKKKGSNNRQKAKAKLAKLHFRIANQRSDFLHKSSDFYTKHFDVICIESLNVRGMVKNRHLGRSILDSSWGEFSRQVQYKSLWRGKDCIKADRWYPSSKTCSECGAVRDRLSLSLRSWVCTCGAVHDRDENASKNLENYGRAAVNARTLEKSSTPAEMPMGVHEAGMISVDYTRNH